MITPEDVGTYLIEPLGEVYPKPARWKAFAAQTAEVCGEWVTTDDLGALARRIITTREAKTFPNIPTLITLAKAIPQTADSPTRPVEKPRKTERIGGRDLSFRHGQDGANEREKAYSEAEKRAYRFLHGTEISAKAVAEHWAPGLIDFCIREGREPSYDEERQIVAKVRANDVDVRDFVDVPDPIKPRGNAHRGPAMPQVGGKMGDTLRRMRAGMHEAAERRLKADLTGTVN